PAENPWVRVASSALSARSLLIGIRRPRIGGDPYTGLVPINTSFAETARWKRCVPRGALSSIQASQRQKKASIDLSGEILLHIDLRAGVAFPKTGPVHPFSASEGVSEMNRDSVPFLLRIDHQFLD